MSSDVKRHRVLIVGAGSIGERHLRCFLESRRVDVSFVETNESLRATIADRYPQAKRFRDLTSAIESGIDAAVIATPAPSHVSLAAPLVDRGVHVLIEKPLAVSLDGVDALQTAVKRRGVVAAVAYVYRAHPALASMREAIVSGRFGRPLEAVAVAGQNFPTYRPAYAQTYYATHASGGGAVQDALTHIINACEWLVGPIDRVVADAAHLALPNVVVEDTVHVIARHGDTSGGVLGSFTLNQHQSPNEITITVICERGTTRFEYHNCCWRFMDAPDGRWTDCSFGPLDRDALFIAQAKAFLNAIEGAAAPLCTLNEGEQTLRANLAILESVRTASWQSLHGRAA